jgi:hypothetical protein
LILTLTLGTRTQKKEHIDTHLPSSTKPCKSTSHSHGEPTKPNKPTPQTYQLTTFLSESPDYKHLLVTGSNPSERRKKHRQGLKKNVHVWGIMAEG